MMPEQKTLTELLFSEEGSSIQGVMETVHLDSSEVLFHRGDPGDAFYYVESGQVRIFTYDEEGRELTLNSLGAGEAFGELALVDEQPRSASVDAVEPTQPGSSIGSDRHRLW